MQNITEHFLAATLWAELDGNDEPFDKNYTIYDVAEESTQAIETECLDFLAKARALGSEASESNLGTDFYLTRQGHGSGFWDKPELYGHKLSQELTTLAKSYSEIYPEVGDDGKIHILFG